MLRHPNATLTSALDVLSGKCPSCDNWHPKVTVVAVDVKTDAGNVHSDALENSASLILLLKKQTEKGG